jgi:hypothetical protein
VTLPLLFPLTSIPSKNLAEPKPKPYRPPNPKKEKTTAPINMTKRKIIEYEFFIYITSGKKIEKMGKKIK